MCELDADVLAELEREQEMTMFDPENVKEADDADGE